MDELGDLVALSVPAGSRVLAVAPEPALLKRLAERGCDTAVSDEAVADTDVEVVVLMGTLAQVTSPPDLLRRVAKVLGPGGQLVASVPNALHAGRRLRTGQDEFLRTFRADRLQQLLAENGLTTVETLRVRRPAVQPDDVPDSVWAYFLAGEDADVDQYVVVASPASGVQSPVPSVNEELQAKLHRAEEELAQRDAALADIDHELQALQLDLAIKDDFAVELRGQVQTAEMRAARLEAELAEARSALDNVEQTLRDQANEVDALRRRARQGLLALLLDRLGRR